MAVIQLTRSEINFFITGTEFSVTKQQILADKNFLQSAGKKRGSKAANPFCFDGSWSPRNSISLQFKDTNWTKSKVPLNKINVSNCWSESLSLNNKVSNENDSHPPLARCEILISRCNFKPWLSNFQNPVTNMVPGELHIHSFSFVKLNLKKNNDMQLLINKLQYHKGNKFWLHSHWYHLLI